MGAADEGRCTLAFSFALSLLARGNNRESSTQCGRNCGVGAPLMGRHRPGSVKSGTWFCAVGV